MHTNADRDRVLDIRSIYECSIQEAEKRERKERLNNALEHFVKTKDMEELEDILYALIND